jgi:hypothetical protein
MEGSERQEMGSLLVASSLCSFYKPTASSTTYVLVLVA